MRVVVLLVVVRAALVSGVWCSGDEGGEAEGIARGMMGAIEVSTSAMLSMCEIGV